MFRRRSAGAQDGNAQDPGAQSSGAPETTTTARRPAEEAKGRPTPKRSEAERRRRQPITGSSANRSSGRAGGGTKADRSSKYQAMKRGEEWALQPKDKGPVKALARDYVDSKRRVSEFYMYVLILLVLALFARTSAVQTYSQYVILALVVAVVIEGILIRRGLHRLIAERLPGQSTRGVTMYAIMRTLQIRKLRMPAPRVRPGDKI